jgi:Ca2+-binding EF-hand superfamily protein
MNSPMRNNNICNPNEMEERQLNDYFKSLMDAESKIEQAKTDLALKCDFNVEDAFRIFENCGRGYLTYDDLKCGLNLLDVCVNDSDIRLLMKRFDLQKNCCLNFTDFFDMLVPFEKDYRNMVENRNPNTYCPNNCPDIFMFQTRNSLKNVFNALIDFENKLNLMKRNYTTLRLKLKDIFNLIDPCCLGSFKSEDLDSYLKKKGIFSNPKDEDLLFIRLDKNRDGKVDYCEFEDELQTQY